MNPYLLTSTIGIILALGVGEAGPARLTSGPPGGSSDHPLTGSYTFAAPVLDIAATSRGTILVTAPPNMIMEIYPDSVATAAVLPVAEGVLVNGLASTAENIFYAATGGLDLALGAAIWVVSDGETRRFADIHAFETENDPDAMEGSRWKQPECEEDSLMGYTAGPQSNPYHLARLSSGTILVADAAGNTLLVSDANGDVDWIATFEPPLDNEGAWGFLRPAQDNDEIDCYIQPVPTAVAVGPDGAYYVGDLTGIPAASGWSRVWRIAPGARHVVCPSEDCNVVLSDLTSVVDVEFGPDGQFYVVELDRNGWLAALTGNPGGGRINRCELATGECSLVYESSQSIAALTFDRWNQLWVAENEVLAGPGAATVRAITLE